MSNRWYRWQVRMSGAPNKGLVFPNKDESWLTTSTTSHELLAQCKIVNKKKNSLGFHGRMLWKIQTLKKSQNVRATAGNYCWMCVMFETSGGTLREPVVPPCAVLPYELRKSTVTQHSPPLHTEVQHLTLLHKEEAMYQLCRNASNFSGHKIISDGQKDGGD